MTLNDAKVAGIPKDEHRISVRIPKEWITKIDFICKVMGVHSTRSQFIRAAVINYIEEQYVVAVEKKKKTEEIDTDANAIAEGMLVDLFNRT